MYADHFITLADNLVETARQERARLVALWQSWRERRKEYLRCQRDYRILLDMPDYLLNDIGITRPLILEAERRRRVFGPFGPLG